MSFEQISDTDALLTKMAELQSRLDEAEETLAAIRSGEIDALLVDGKEGQQVFTLEGAEHSYRLFVEGMHEGAVTVRADGLILYCNNRFASLVETPLNKIIGSYFYDFIIPSQQEDSRVFLDGSVDRRQEFELLSPDGSGIPVVLALAASVIDENSGGMCMIVTDIRDQKHLEKLQINKEQLEELVKLRTSTLNDTTEQLNSFCYSIVHDLKAPLRAQQGYAKAILDEYGELIGDEGKHFATRIVVAAEKLERLVQDLLSHVSISRQDLPVQRVNLPDVVDQVLMDLRETIQNSKAQVKVESLGHAVKGHEPSCNLIVSNLVNNALKYAKKDVPPRVKIWSEVVGENVRLWVEDEGIGIEAEYCEKIFGVFQRLHTPEAYPGTGIGLAVVKRGTERMGGKTGVFSTPDKGSKFWIELPIYR